MKNSEVINTCRLLERVRVRDPREHLARIGFRLNGDCRYETKKKFALVYGDIVSFYEKPKTAQEARVQCDISFRGINISGMCSA